MTLAVKPLDMAKPLCHEAALVLFYPTVPTNFSLEDYFRTQHGFPIRAVDHFPKPARDLSVHLALARALPFRPLGGRPGFAQGGGFLRQVTRVAGWRIGFAGTGAGRAHEGRE